MKLRPRHFRFRSIAAAGFATLLALAGGVFLFVTPAAATTDGVTSLGSFAVSPTSLPPLTTGVNAQTASNILFSIPSAVTTGDTITLQVQPHSSTNCSTSSTDFIGFNNAGPITATATGSGAPTFVVSITTAASDPGTCAGVGDVLTLTLTNNAGTGPFPVTVAGIEYNAGATADAGNVGVGILSTTTTPTTTTFFTPSAGVTSPPSNATVTAPTSTATANSPAVIVTNSGGTGTISNIVVTESTAGAVSHSLCIAPDTSPATPTAFTFTGAGTTTAGVGSGAVVGASTLPSGAMLVVITTSSTTATTYTISGATVTTSSAVSGPAAVTVTTGSTSCALDTTGISSGLVALDVAPTVMTSIAGADADGTAIAEMKAAFPFPAGCPTNHAVVLATDQTFPDALAASYLAGYLGTGILLTPTAALSSETQTALENEGITSVYVVGGTLAISANTISQVDATPSYHCGGPSAGATTGFINVVQTLAGQTQYDTAQQIANFPTSSAVHSFNLSGAYAGQYNDTTGNESSTPSATGALRTAIVATGASYQTRLEQACSRTPISSRSC